MTLSVVIVIASDTVRRPAHVEHLRHCLRGLFTQQGAPALEIVVPHLSGTVGLEQLAGEFPAARFLEVGELSERVPGGPYRDHHDELRARAIAVTSGDLIALLEDHEVPDARWAAEVVAAHAAGDHAAVGGAVENAIARPLNWAVCLCDFSHYLNPLPAGRSEMATDVNVAYKRDALEAIAPVWRSRFHERRVHDALIAAGRTLALSRSIVVRQRRSGLTAGDALVERFVWGRSYAATRSDGWGTGRRLLYAACCTALPAVLVMRIVRILLARRRISAAVLRSLPWVCVLSAAWSLGELTGYGWPRRQSVPRAAAENPAVRTS
jgi:hypothetical protein